LRTIVFDTQALLKFYFGEPGSDVVEGYLKQILEKRVKGYINLITLTELYYILARVSEEIAEEKERNLRSFGVKVVSLRDKSSLWKTAAKIKARNALSLADAFGAATALFLKSTLLTGADKEFSRIDVLKIERVS
jgi:predicted nucleic acid-binding protein